jgi:phosphopantothenoylcysteine decarboxylase/phosphopantothenate--cysteine ligase
MGVAIALELIRRGATVDLVCGPGVLVDSHTKGLAVHPVITASQMHHECMRRFPDAQLTIMAAAVADYTISNPSSTKIKKSSEDDPGMQIKLTPTVDILAEMGKARQPGQTLIGFALETHRELENAIDKLKRKNLDLIVLNSLQNAGAGFEYDTNQVTLIGKDGVPHEFPLKNKKEVAVDLINHILEKNILK